MLMPGLALIVFAIMAAALVSQPANLVATPLQSETWKQDLAQIMDLLF
jgi:hypothetical protein